MNLDTDVVKKLLYAFDFKRLFRELGWDQLAINPVLITVDHEKYTWTPVAEKRGAQVYLCTTDVIPGAVLRHKIDNQLTRHAHEHLLIFADTAQSHQVWQWAAHTPGQPHFLRSYEWHKGQAGGILTQRLAEIAISISEEESIDLTLVTHRLKDAFDRDRVTKRFYELFEKERQRFQGAVRGLPDENAAKWYSSVVVNRLMFIYFLQKQGFLDHGDRDYLRKKLDFIQSKGPGQGYRDFLLPLFFDGFSKSERSGDIRTKLGDVPYLNGGLFAVHILEEKYGDGIQISDAALTELLDFFDRYQWTLDDRPLAKDNEINPDVLGYIFEKYVNQKQMGAYYTKEDITGYISQETVIPRLFDMVKAKYKPAFEGHGSVFGLLKEDPDAYIYTAMCRGARDNDGNTIPLPANIACGLDDVSQRGEWNKSANPEYALPTEIWREVISRTQRYEEVRRHLSDGDITDINDLITYNLDIRQFAQDAISQSEDPVFVLRFFEALGSITILDPTCGSGAFLFAALNILERLYEACLQRMEQFQHDGATYQGQQLRALEEFNSILKEADKHSNRRYHILKSIVVHNLYGVDIMEEAVEICKLRLFLRLVAELKPGQPVEPLPDIDFNIKAGNTLVGYVHLKDAVNAATKQLFGEQAAVRMQEKAEDLARLYRKMQEQQMTLGGRVTPEDKRALQQRRSLLVDELDGYLAYDYGVQTQKPNTLKEWRAKTQPFQWFAEFYDIMHAGGFDAVIGNPPYVAYEQVKSQYEVRGYATLPCGDLYAFVLERALNLLANGNRSGMIVRLASVTTPRTSSLRGLLEARHCGMHISAYSASAQPSCLFEGVRDRLAILLLQPDSPAPRVFSTYFMKWLADERPVLFTTRLRYEEISGFPVSANVPKLGSHEGKTIYAKLQELPRLVSYVTPHGKYVVYYHESPVYWPKAWRTPPYYWQEGRGAVESVSLRELRFDSKHKRDAMFCLANSSLLYWFLSVSSDCRHLTTETFNRFAVPFDCLEEQHYSRLTVLANLLEGHYELHKRPYVRTSKKTGESRFDAYYPAKSKDLIDQIDLFYGGLYGLAREETDFIINYDIKFRMGADDEDGEDNE